MISRKRILLKSANKEKVKPEKSNIKIKNRKNIRQKSEKRKMKIGYIKAKK